MRSLLAVDGADPAAIAEATASDADALLLDLAGAALASGARASVYIRLPPLDDPEALSALETAVRLAPKGVVLTGAEGGADVQRLGARLAVQEALAGLAEGCIGVLALATETPRAIFGLSSYRAASTRLQALIWSADPLAGALRARRDRATSDSPLRLARNLCQLAARAAGVAALDAPYRGDDLAALRAEAEAARDDGFDGKVAVNAAQAAVINAVFTPGG